MAPTKVFHLQLHFLIILMLTIALLMLFTLWKITFGNCTKKCLANGKEDGLLMEALKHIHCFQHSDSDEDLFHTIKNELHFSERKGNKLLSKVSKNSD